MNVNKRRLLLIAVFLTSLCSVFWMMSVNNTFIFDDSTLLRNAHLTSYEDLFNFYPSSVYLDRPVRDVLIKFMYDLFQRDYTLYHVFLVLVHLFNVGIAFLAAKRVFSCKYGTGSDQSFIGAAIAAVIFGAWPNSLMAVQWVSGNNDLMGTTFALLSILFFARYTQEKEYRGQNFCLQLLFFYLAIRTKEMFYPLPLILILLEIYQQVCQKVRIKISKGSIVNLLVMSFFAIGMVYLKLQDRTMTIDSSAPYYQSFNPIDMLKNLMRYCMRCFDLSTGSFSYEYSISGYVGLIVILIGLVTAIITAWFKREIGPLLCYISIGLSIGMVLPMINQVHRLYLYYPMFFVGMVAACAVLAISKYREKIFIGICAGCILANLAAGPRAFKDYWKSIGSMEKSVYDQIEMLDKPVHESNIYVRLADSTTYTPFYYGPGSVINLIFEDMTLKTTLLDLQEEVEYIPPYVVLKYENEIVTELERNTHRELHIQDVYAAFQEDGSLLLGITPNKIKSTLQILIDDIETPTTIGSEFISSLSPAESLVGKDKIQIVLRDEYNTRSEPWTIYFDDIRDE